MNTLEIKTIEIKLIKAYDTVTESKVSNSFDEIINAIDLKLNSGGYSTIYIEYSNERAISEIAEYYKASYSQGVSDGCYGARTGKQFEGWTLWLPLEHEQDYIETYDGDCDPVKVINPLNHITNNGGELLDLNEDQIEGFLDIADMIDMELHHDNTYNHEFENCTYSTDFDFKFIGDYENNKNILIAKFHCGGDIRGNYTRLYAFKFEDTDSLYNVLSPHAEIDDSEKIKELAHLINCQPADVELLKQELESLIESNL